MNCQNAQKQAHAAVDRMLSEEERENISKHLERCRECASYLESMEQLRANLRGMGHAPVPARLSGQLRVLVSYERVRRIWGNSLPSPLERWATRMRLAFEELMHQLALPFAGGLLSALVLFGALVPALAFPHNYWGDVPMPIYTDPAPVAAAEQGWLELMNPVVNDGDDTVVELTIDEHGRVTYYVTHGVLTPEMENNLVLFSRFTPATLFGQPTWGRVMISFRPRGHIVVKG
jgi:hypothetical protein